MASKFYLVKEKCHFSAIPSAPQQGIRLYIFLQEFIHAIDDNMAISYMFMYENMNENTRFRDRKA